jgi:hypothetical protein
MILQNHALCGIQTMVYVDIGNMEVDARLMDLIGYFLFRNLLSSTHIPCRVSMPITKQRLMID